MTMRSYYKVWLYEKVHAAWLVIYESHKSQPETTRSCAEGLGPSHPQVFPEQKTLCNQSFVLISIKSISSLFVRQRRFAAPSLLNKVGYQFKMLGMLWEWLRAGFSQEEPFELGLDRQSADGRDVAVRGEAKDLWTRCQSQYAYSDDRLFGDVTYLPSVTNTCIIAVNSSSDRLKKLLEMLISAVGEKDERARLWWVGRYRDGMRSADYWML